MTLADHRSNEVTKFMFANFSPSEISELRAEYGNDKEFAGYMAHQYEQAEKRRVANACANFYPELSGKGAW